VFNPIAPKLHNWHRASLKNAGFTPKKLPKLVFLFIKVFDGLINKFATHFL